MSRCQKCNAELPDGARFCNVCGSAQLPTGSLSVTATPVKQETDVTIQDVVTSIPNTPPTSPAVPLNPTRTIHPGIKQSTLPGGAGSDFLLPTSPEIPQQISGEMETVKTSGELEISKDMIPETPKPTVDTN